MKGEDENIGGENKRKLGLRMRRMSGARTRRALGSKTGLRNSECVKMGRNIQR